MRSLALLLAATFASFTSAQTGADRTPLPGPVGTTLEDDNDPFVPNAFIGSFRMEMHRFHGGTEDRTGPTNMRFWSSADRTLHQLEMPGGQGAGMKVMTDLKGKWSYTLVDDGKGKRIAMKSRKKKPVLTADAPDGEKPMITVTEETKAIDGHACTKVIAKSKEGTWTGWVAQDIAMPFSDLMRNLQRGRPDPAMEAWKDVKGFPLEYEWTDQDGSRMVVYMKDLELGDVDSSVFSLDGYEVREMPALGR
ncbi:MAG: DUF4412 domain-containing protein [Bacteroidetes bacterium]|nr:DUF4412 domain-containing protein [Bacteroidota bacterium]